MKKKSLILLTLLLAFCLTACGMGETAFNTVVMTVKDTLAEQEPQAAELEAEPEPQAAASEAGDAPSAEPEIPAEPEIESPSAAEETPALQPEPDVPDESESQPEDEPALLPEDGSYTSKEEVALYLHQYGHLPDNFITKREAEALGWPGGDLEPYAPGMCIGGNRFGNYEGLLPEKEGRSYTECDIDTLGARSRGAKRIVVSNDGLSYYTEDHYETFELLYGEE